MSSAKTYMIRSVHNGNPKAARYLSEGNKLVADNSRAKTFPTAPEAQEYLEKLSKEQLPVECPPRLFGVRSLTPGYGRASVRHLPRYYEGPAIKAYPARELSGTPPVEKPKASLLAASVRAAGLALLARAGTDSVLIKQAQEELKEAQRMLLALEALLPGRA